MGNSKRNIKKLNDNFRESILEYAISHNLKTPNTLVEIYTTTLRPKAIETNIKNKFNKKNNKINIKIIRSKLQ